MLKVSGTSTCCTYQYEMFFTFCREATVEELVQSYVLMPAKVSACCHLGRLQSHGLITVTYWDLHVCTVKVIHSLHALHSGVMVMIKFWT